MGRYRGGGKKKKKEEKMTLNDPWKERQGSIASSVLDDVDKSIVLCYGEIRNLKIIDTGRW